jgi:serine/threonine protein kinase
VVAVLRYNPKRVKFVKQEPNWAPKWATLAANVNEEPHVVIMQRGCGSNLRDWILNQKFDANAKPEVTLVKSMEYALDIARGMRHLHSQNPPVIHHNLNSSNILVIILFFFILLFAKLCLRFADFKREIDKNYRFLPW